MTGLSHHPWLGPLLGDTEIAAILSAETNLARMLKVEAAWTRTIAPKDVADHIASQIETAKIRPTDLAAGTARDGVPLPTLIALLKDVISEDAHRWLHKGLTSQDVIDTAQMLAIAEVLSILGTRLNALITDLQRLAERDGDNALMGMTRMQPALPITAGDRITNWMGPLGALRTDLPVLQKRCAILQWGGPVGVRDAILPSDTGTRFAAELGLNDPGSAWHSQRGVLADLANFLAQLTGALGKFGTDVALMAQSGKSTINLSSGGGSSAMPHKQNPVYAEVLIALARQNAGNIGLMHQAMLHEQERSGSAWMLEWMVLPHMMEATGCALKTALMLLAGIQRIGNQSSQL